MKKIYLFFFIFLLFCFPVCFSFAEVRIDQIDGLVDWNKAENYAEAKETLKIAKRINAEKKRRKQLRDAGVPENEIKRIIKQERENENSEQKATNVKGSSITATNNNIDNEDNDDEENEEDEDDNSEGKINNYSNKSSFNSFTKPNDTIKIRNNGQNEQLKKETTTFNNNEKEQRIIRAHKKIVPSIPKIIKQGNVILADNSDIDDNWKLSRMLKKAGDNINNRENFMIFASEAEKIANNKQNVDDFMSINMLDADIIYEFDDEQEEPSYFSQDRETKRYASKKTSKKTINNNKQKRSNKERSIRKFYASSKDEYKARIKDESNNKNYDVMIGKNTMNEKQIVAKNLGAPYPEERNNKDKKTQYQPQNIAQIAYDKNNRHLQPVVFEDHVIDQAFEKLGDKDAVSIARALIDKFGKTDITDKDGNTLLMHAVARENQSLVATLLAEGADPNYLNKDGFAPIHLAASNGDNVAMYSIVMYGGNPNLRDKEGNTALMYAAKMCNIDTIKLMIALGGDSSQINAMTGKSVIDFATENKNPVVLTLLEQKKLSMFRKRNPTELTLN